MSTDKDKFVGIGSIELSSSKQRFDSVEPIPYIKLGIEQFDDKFNGLCSKGLTIIGGFPGQGKSMLLLQMALLLSSYKTVYYASCENSDVGDICRANDIMDQYDINVNGKFIYSNLSQIIVDISKEAESSALQPLDVVFVDAMSKKADIIFIDGVEYLRPSIFENDTSNYEKLAERLGSLSNKIPIVTSWHLKTQMVGLDDMTQENFGRTNRAPQVATTAFIIGSNDFKDIGGHRWLKLVKTRHSVPNEAWRPLDIDTINHTLDLRGSNI